MADPSPNTDSIITSKPLKNEEEVMVEKKSTLRSRQPLKNVPDFEEIGSRYKEVIVKLPKEERWMSFVMRKYKGFWQPERYLSATMEMEEAFKSRPDDVIVTSYPKSDGNLPTKKGTTWLKALTFTIVHRNKYNFSCHPLLQLNPHDCVPFIEYYVSLRDEQYLETLPSPRVLGTHVPYSILPENMKTSKCSIVYICREPKDIFVSLWHWLIKSQFKETCPFTQAFELFCEGRMPYGPIWDHVFEYYEKSLQCPSKILLLKYEEMMKGPIDGVMRIANFLGCPFSEEEIKNGIVEQIVELCSFTKLKDLDVNKNGIGDVKNDHFFREAVVGDWENYMTTEMATKLDEITKEKLLDLGFTYRGASIGDDQTTMI